MFNRAKNSPKAGKCRLVAAIVKRNKILAIQSNSYNSSFLARRYPKNKKSLYNHAEIAVLRDFVKTFGRERLRDCEMFIIRAKQTPRGQWLMGSSKPCEGCELAINESGLKKFYYFSEK